MRTLVREKRIMWLQAATKKYRVWRASVARKWHFLAGRLSDLEVSGE
jgi:hypothetical protein